MELNFAIKFLTSKFCNFKELSVFMLIWIRMDSVVWSICSPWPGFGEKARSVFSFEATCLLHHPWGLMYSLWCYIGFEFVY